MEIELSPCLKDRLPIDEKGVWILWILLIDVLIVSQPLGDAPKKDLAGLEYSKNITKEKKLS